MRKKRLLIQLLCLLVLIMGTIPISAGDNHRGATRSSSRGTTHIKATRTAPQTGRATPRGATSRATSHRGGNRRGGSGNHQRHRSYRYYGYPSYYWGGPYFDLYSSFYYGFGYGAWGWGSPYYGGYYNHYRYVRNHDSGSIKLKVQPKDAQVYLNGQHLGKAGKFDGWPSSLWLDKGVYELVLYKDGMETVRKEIEVFPRMNQKLRLEMAPGAAKPVEEVSKALANREKQRKELYSRYSKNRDKRKDPKRERAPKQVVPRTPGDSTGNLDLRSQPAQLSLAVEPGDAAIFLDGRFVSSARDLAHRKGLITLDAGSHEIEIMRPGHKGEKRTFKVEPGQTLELKFDLDNN